MSNTFGTKLKTTIFGQSHSEAIGVVVDGLPAGIRLDMEHIRDFMARRAPGRDRFSTKRREPDTPEIISGLVDGVTCGAPLCAVIHNRDTRSSDYSGFERTPRPSHSDYTAWLKFNGFNDIRGGGQFSGRLTAPLCFAGAAALQVLHSKGIVIGAHILGVAGIRDDAPDLASVDEETLALARKNSFPALSAEKCQAMMDAIDAARAAGDSVGGIIRCCCLNFPAGLGEPMFDGIENRIAQGMFAIPAVRGVSFGAGFDAASMRGSQHNDPFCMVNGAVRTRTNNHGGVLGGITTGMPIITDVAFKPTPSISLEQDTVDLVTGENCKIAITGRHDPCIVQRAVPCVEAVMAMTLLDFLL